jgi:hypothetical protein
MYVMKQCDGMEGLANASMPFSIEDTAPTSNPRISAEIIERLAVDNTICPDLLNAFQSKIVFI